MFWDLLIYKFDYIDFIIIGITIYLAYAFHYTKDLNSGGVIFVVIVIMLFVLVLNNYIFNGVYLANFVKKDGLIIGKGTRESASFRFEKHNGYIALYDDQQYDYDNKKSSPFVECYTYKNIETICINPLGLAEIINKHDSNKKSILYIDN